MDSRDNRRDVGFDRNGNDRNRPGAMRGHEDHRGERHSQNRDDGRRDDRNQPGRADDQRRNDDGRGRGGNSAENDNRPARPDYAERGQAGSNTSAPFGGYAGRRAPDNDNGSQQLSRAENPGGRPGDTPPSRSNDMPRR